MTAGEEIKPKEQLYFRQEIEKGIRGSTCKQPQCWVARAGYSDYCSLHVKMFKEKGTQLLVALTEKLGKAWPQFIHRIT